MSGFDDTSSEGDIDDNGFEDTCDKLCTISQAAVGSATCAFITILATSISLHTTKMSMTSAERDNMRCTIVHNITGSNRHCKDMLRVSSAEFKCLCSVIQSDFNARNYCRGSIEEQLVTFLMKMGHNLRHRFVGVILCRSIETISRYFHNMLGAIISMHSDYVKQPTGEYVQSEILNSARFYPYFKDCIGAIDGTHVRVKVSPIEAMRYRGRKDWPTQNVLATCTLDLKFTYMLAGWESSASDSRIFQNALEREQPLSIPPGKYYLGDAGFGLSSRLITPYGRTRYHLKEYSHRGPETQQELFNHRHASLRNSIERAFGLLKRRFPIIASGSECQYNIKVSTEIILACAVLHNFLLPWNGEGVDEHDLDDTIAEEPNEDGSAVGVQTQEQETASLEFNYGSEIRDVIAEQMWNDYISRGV